MAWEDLQDTTQRSQRGQVTRSLGGKAVTPTKQVSTTSIASNIGTIARQTGSLISRGLEKTGEFVVNTPRYTYEGVKPFLNSAARVVTGNLSQDIKGIESQRVQLDDQLTRVAGQYRAGKISKENYNKFLRSYSDSNAELSKSAQTLERDLNKETKDAMISAANTAATVLLGGRLQLGAAPKAAARRTATAVSTTQAKRRVLQSVVDQSATKLEKAVTEIPAVRDLVVRNLEYLGRREAQQLAGETAAQYIAREGKSLATNLLLKRPILYESNIQGAQQVYDKIIEGDYGDAAKQSAWLSTQMLSGGPLGAAARGFGWLKNRTNNLAYGSGSFIDELSKQIGTKQSSQVAEYLTNLKTADPAKFKEAEKVLRVVQEANLQMAGEDAAQAANRVLQHWDQYGIQLDTVQPEQVVNLLKNWADAHQTLVTGIKNGIVPEGSVVARWDVAARQALAKNVEDAGDDIQKILDVYDTWRLAPGNAAGQNTILTNKIENIFNNSMKSGGGGARQMAEEIRNLNAASIIPKNIPEAMRKQLGKLGFVVAQPSRLTDKITPAVDYNDTRKLVTAVQSGDTEIFDVAQAAQPQLNFLAKSLERLGISPKESNAAANRTLSQQVVADLDAMSAKKLGFSTGADANTTEAGRVILSKLQRYVEDKQPSKIGNAFVAGRAVGPALTDIRQLTTKEIMEALNVTSEQAKAVSSAVINAYAKVPMEFRGLGDKVVDNLYKFNPLQKYYSRIQGALRYTYNPFFRTQEAFETAALSRAQARAIVWNKSTAELDNAARILDDAGVFKTGLSGEAAQDIIIGRISANLTQGQKRNLAGLAERMAEQRNMTLVEMLQKHPEDVTDALRVVVQYPNKGILNSSLARTLNVAFFPARYNAKVTQLAAQILSKEPPAVQLATINSLFKLRDWLKSDEGIQWQSENSEALQVFNWLTPVGSIKYGLERLTRRPDSIGELGSLGGLPLGVISQMLDSQGIITINTPYVSPKTGDVIPKYIPETTKAKAATAMGDLLNSMFTYPGRTLGLPGKNQAINTIVREFIDTNGTDFEKRIDTERLTPLQENWIRVLKGDTSEEAIDALYNSPAPGEFNGYTLPPMELPMRAPLIEEPTVTQRTGLPTKASQKSAKKAKNVALPITQ